MPHALTGVEIFDVGTWVGSNGPMKWTLEDLLTVVDNTTSLIGVGFVKPMMKFGHSMDQFWDEAKVLDGQNDGDPSIGWASNFRMIGTKIVCDFTDIPDVVYAAIQNKLYTQISAELKYIQNFGWYVSAIALLGADPPAVKTLQDLQAYLTQSEQKQTNSEPVAVLAFSEPKFYNDGGSMPETVIKPAPTPDAAVEAIVKENAQLKANFSQAQANSAAMKKKTEEQEAELAKMKKQFAKESFKSQFSQLVAPYEADSLAGKLKPAIVDKIKAHFTAQEEGFTQTSNLTMSPELSREVAIAYSESLPKGTAGQNNGKASTGESADEVFFKEVRKIQTQNRSMSYSEAARALNDVKPELVKEYVCWTDRVSNSGRPQGGVI